MAAPIVDTYLGTPLRPAALPPTYQEAYPRLNLGEVLAAIKERKRLCVWAHPSGKDRGYGLLSIREGEIMLHYLVFPFYGEPSRNGVERLRLRDVALGQGRSRQLLVCSCCDQGVTRLIFFRGWKCRACQELRYRSSAITAKSRRSERARQLEAELRAGRPKGIHETTMQKKRAELKDLRRLERQDGRRQMATIDRRRHIHTSWLRAVEHRKVLEHIMSVDNSQCDAAFSLSRLRRWLRLRESV